jgi:hypothetical protein
VVFLQRIVRHIAPILAPLLLLGACASAQSREDAPQPKPAQQTANSEQRATQPIAPSLKQEPTSQRDYPASDQKPTNNSPQSRTWNVTEWSAFIQAVSAAFVAVFTFFLVWYSHRGWQAAHASAETAVRAADHAERSLRALEIGRLMIGDWKLKEIGESWATVTYSLTNTGRSEIRITNAIGSLTLTKRGQFSPLEPAINERSGVDLPGGSELHESMQIRFSAGDFARLISPDSDLVLLIQTRCDYTDIFGEGHFRHATAFYIHSRDEWIVPFRVGLNTGDNPGYEGYRRARAVPKSEQ